MTPTIAVLLIVTFLVSVVGLLALIWSIATNQFGHGKEAAKTIFPPGEEGHGEDPARDISDTLDGNLPPNSEAINARQRADFSSRGPVLAWLCSAVFWLVVGSFLRPDFVDQDAHAGVSCQQRMADLWPRAPHAPERRDLRLGVHGRHRRGAVFCCRGCFVPRWSVRASPSPAA